jgi:hypothetical protein
MLTEQDGILLPHPAGLARHSCATRCVWLYSCRSAKVVGLARLHTLTQVRCCALPTWLRLDSWLNEQLARTLWCSWQQMLVAVVPLPLTLQQHGPTKLLCAMSCWPAEGTFRPERIRAIAARFNLDTEAVLDNVSGRPAGAGMSGLRRVPATLYSNVLATFQATSCI